MMYPTDKYTFTCYRQHDFDAGNLPDFLPETKSIRDDSSWRVSYSMVKRLSISIQDLKRKNKLSPSVYSKVSLCSLDMVLSVLSVYIGYPEM